MKFWIESYDAKKCGKAFKLIFNQEDMKDAQFAQMFKSLRRRKKEDKIWKEGPLSAKLRLLSEMVKEIE